MHPSTQHVRDRYPSHTNYLLECDADSPLYAERVTAALVQRTVDLDQLPRKGKVVSELNEDTIRERSLYSYRIMYEIKSDNLIIVLAVIHKQQHLEAEDVPRG